MGDEKNKDVFFEAAANAAKAALAVKESQAVTATSTFKDQNIEIIKERIAEGETQWDLLKRMIDGSFTERFITVMHEMNDRDFARNYLKLLEHFKPKIVRAEGSFGEGEDNNITINAVIINEKGEKQILTLNDGEDN